mgnify:CR=1 FL=1
MLHNYVSTQIESYIAKVKIMFFVSFLIYPQRLSKAEELILLSRLFRDGESFQLEYPAESKPPPHRFSFSSETILEMYVLTPRAWLNFWILDVDLLNSGNSLKKAKSLVSICSFLFKTAKLSVTSPCEPNRKCRSFARLSPSNFTTNWPRLFRLTALINL